MKALKFEPHLVALMLKGEKSTTWRLFDDKNLSTGDEIACVNRESGAQFGTAKVVWMSIKPLGKLTDEDWLGHERFKNDEEMCATYQSYYPTEAVNSETLVKFSALSLSLARTSTYSSILQKTKINMLVCE